MKQKSNNKIVLIYLGIALILVFLFSYTIRDPLYLPIHIDEWHHLEQSRKLFDENYVFNTSSYRVGFHILLLPLWFFSHPVLVSIYLPALFSLLSAITLFFLIKTVFDSQTAVGGVLLFAVFGSTFNLLGKDLLVPLGASLSLVFLYLYFWYRWIYKNEEHVKYYFFGSFIASAIAYPLSAMFFIPIGLIILIIKKKYIESAIVVGMISAGISYVYWIEGTIQSLIFKYGWGVVEMQNKPTELLPWFVLLMVPFGIWVCIKNKIRLFTILPFILGIWIVWYRIFDFSPWVPYQRVFYYFCLSLLFLAISGYHMLGQYRKYAFIIFAILVLHSIYTESLMTDRNVFIDKLDYELLYKLNQFPKGMVLTDPGQGIAVYAITGNDVFSTVYFQRAHASRTREKLLNCEFEESSYVYTHFELECEYLVELIYSKGFRFLYKVN